MSDAQVPIGSAVLGAGAPTLVATLPAADHASTMRAAHHAADAGAHALSSADPVAHTLAAAGKETGLPVIAYVTSTDDAERVADHADMLRIATGDPHLLRAAARTGRPILLERAPGTTMTSWLSAADLLADEGAPGVALGERGNDIGTILTLQNRSTRPIMLDPHTDPALLTAVSRAALGAGADGLFLNMDDAGTAALLLHDLTVTSALLSIRESPERNDAAPQSGPVPELTRLRQQLDVIDEQFVRLVARRHALATVIGEIKVRHRLPVRDLRREIQVLEHAKTLAGRLAVSPDTVSGIFNHLIDDAVTAQCAALPGRHAP
ncbi:chorismate mutase [Actinomadura barringtoniae]|uniref:Chorismate mutase n=1 Tax=Actinomadura barringtoniae TaxID=1427535 RepID=A0A939PAD8_9ACTN|nr:chorismate mutase [Actinomadura barringtoniae]MBO2445949.1 chorismate mutase [Actinomadura barringtoniae]